MTPADDSPLNPFFRHRVRHLLRAPSPVDSAVLAWPWTAATSRAGRALRGLAGLLLLALAALAVLLPALLGVLMLGRALWPGTAGGRVGLFFAGLLTLLLLVSLLRRRRH